MDQYFERLNGILNNEQMPTRIRFLVQDIIEMRNNKWIPRKLGKAPEGPRTIQQVREDAYRDGCIYMPQQSSSPPSHKVGMGIPNPLEGMFFDNKKQRKGMEDLFISGGGYPSGGSSGYLGTGPGVINNYDNGPSPPSSPVTQNGVSNSNNGFMDDRKSPNYDHRRSGGNSSLMDSRLADKPDFGDRYSANRSNRSNNDRRYNNDNNRSSNYNNSNDNRGHRGGDRRDYRERNSPSSRDNYRNDNDQNNSGALPPRFKKIHHQNVNKEVNNDVSLRPHHHHANNMLFKPKTPSILPKSAISKTDGNSPLGENSLCGPPQMSNSKNDFLPLQNRVVVMQQKESPMIIKQGSLDKGKKDKNKGNKGPTRDEVFAKMEAVLTELFNHRSTNESITAWKENINDWLPNKMNQTALNHFYKVMLEKSAESADDENSFGDNLELALALVDQLVKDDNISFNSTHCQEALAKSINSAEAADDAAKENMAEIAAWSVDRGYATLGDFSSVVSGQYYPVFLMTLGKLMKKLGTDKVKESFLEHKIVLSDHVPVKNDDSKLVSVLEEYGLTCLAPLLSIKQEMSKQLTADPNANAFYKWILENVDETYHKQPDFILALYGQVMNYIVSSTTCPAGTDTTVTPDKSATEQEKELLFKFRSVLQPFVADNAELQLVAVYALQVFCHSMNFPKGMLLRCFVNFYEMDIMDERAFLQWKEDVKHTYEGKGKALFQVIILIF